MKLISIFRGEVMFSCGFSVLVKLEFGHFGFVEGEKPKYPENPSPPPPPPLLEQGVNQNKLNHHMAPDRNQTRVTLMGAGPVTNTPSLLPCLTCSKLIHNRLKLVSLCFRMNMKIKQILPAMRILLLICTGF